MKKLIIWVLILFVYLFPKVLFNRETFFFADNYSLLIPGKIFLTHELKQGNFPLWNPYIFSGSPFFADISQSILYPSTLLFLFLSPATAVNINILLHLLISTIGIYWISKSYLSSTIWLMSSPLLISINNIAAIQSLTWMPWIIGLFLKIHQKRSYSLFLPLVIFLSVSGGHPQPFIEAFILGLVIYLVTNRQRLITKLKFLTKLVIVSGLLLTIIIIPFIELTSLSTRSRMKYTDSLESSTHPLHILDLVFPNAFSNPDLGMVWGINWNSSAKHGIFITYLGLASLICIILNFRKLNRPQQVLLIGGFLSILFALGKYLPGFTLLYKYIPGLSWFRNLSLILYIFIFSSVILIPIGLNFLKSKPSKLIAYCGVLVALLFLTIDLWFNKIPTHYSPFHTYFRDYLIVWNLLFYLSLSLLIFWLSRRYELLTLPLIAINMGFVVKPYIFTAPSHIYQIQTKSPYQNLNLTNYFRTLPTDDYLDYTGLSVYWQNMLIKPPFGESRYSLTEQQTYHDLLTRQISLSPNWNIVYQIPTISGYATFVPKSAADYWQFSTRQSNVNRIDSVGFDDSRLNDHGVKYFIVDKHIFNHQLPKEFSADSIYYDSPDLAIIENKLALPYIRSTSLKLSISPQTSNTNQIIFYTHGLADDVIINITPYPGWTCQLDNKSCPLISKKSGYQISVPSGNHQIILSFTPSYWLIICIISGLSWSVYLFILLRYIYAQKNR